jgi:hypothetical protein
MRRFYMFFCIAAIITVSAACDDMSDAGNPPIEWIYVGSADGPAFQNGWSNSTMAGDQDLAFGIDSDGFLHIVGEIQDASPVVTSEKIFHLPERYRPKKHQYATIYCWGAGYIPGDISLLTTGGFYIGGVNPSTAYLNLVFKID